MVRTERLQGLRLMRFEKVYGRMCRRELGQQEAAEILGDSERTFQLCREHTKPRSPVSRQADYEPNLAFSYSANDYCAVRPCTHVTRSAQFA
jgi:hypothetical protein